jgi:uncharacterized caspase-like protein
VTGNGKKTSLSRPVGLAVAGMISQGSRLSRGLTLPRGLALSVGLTLAIGLASPAFAARYALVVGIDDYELPINDLHGAVNDAKDIATALDKSGADRVVLLTNKEVTRAALEGAWNGLLAEAKEGDTLIFTYAGHGSQEPASENDPNESDALDENFPLAGYGLKGNALSERIVDNDIAQWLKDAAAKNVHVIFVADACHSGTMYRAVSLGVTYRAAPKVKIDPAELLEFTPPKPQVSERIGADDEVTFLAGVSDERLVPEVEIEGVARGALSFSFARALEGAADADADGEVTEKELTTFVRTKVQQLTDSQQVPQSFPPVSRARAVFKKPASEGDTGQPAQGDTAAVEEAIALALKTASASPLTLAYRGGAGPADVAGATIVGDESEAELVYDIAKRSVEKRVAGVVAEEVAPEGLPGIVAKWRAIAVLKAAAGEGVVAFEVASGPRTYAKGEKLTVALGTAPKPYMTLFNLPPNGRVEFFYPSRGNERDEDWRTKPFSLPLQVKEPPFGAEHLIAIMSDQPLDELHTALKGLGTPDAAIELPGLLKNALADQSIAIGIASIFTTSGE